MRLKILLAVAIFPLAGLIAWPALADVGRITASYKVDSLGDFEYTIPISLPPGPHGVTPQIALAYDSESEIPSYDGPKGVELDVTGSSSPDVIPAGAGWVLTGLSMIERMPSTYTEDGSALGYQYKATDQYALDGNRLRLTSSGDYGEDDSTYQTEIADFSQATAHGTTAYGPSYWTVQRKNGLTYEYGNTPDSQVLEPSGASGEIREWLLDKVSDEYGNSYTISYGAGASGSSGIAVPTKISWTPASQGSSSYNYTASFTYITPVSSDKSSGFTLAGGTIENDSLLSSISISYLGTPVRYYQLSYSPSTVTGRSLLTSIEECADSSMSKCITPTGFAYNGGLPGSSSSGQTAVSGATSIIGAYDFTGNGLSDILYYQGSTFYVAFSNGAGFNGGVSTGIAPWFYVIGDILGNGEDEILTTESNVWYSYRWNGSEFTPTDLNVPLCSSCTFELADVNGDGLPDLVQLETDKGAITLSVALNTSSNGLPSFGAMTPWGVNIPEPQYTTGQVLGGGFITPQTYFQSFDRVRFEGVQRNEIMLSWQTILGLGGQNQTVTVVDELIPSGHSFNGQQVTYYTSQTGDPPPQTFYGNFNRDKCTDYTLSGSGISTIYYSACNGQGEQIVTSAGTMVGTVDWDGDGLTDLLLNNGGALGIETATGTGFNSVTTTNIPLASGNTVLPLTVTGSGLQDIGVISGGTLTYYLHNSVSDVQDDPPDAMTALTDGNGNTIHMSYSSTTAATGVYTAGAATSSGDSPYTGSLFVVQTLTFPDGIGGTYTKTYHYSDARTGSYGFEGFSQIKATDSRSGEYRETSYDLLFPETGMVTEDDLFQPDGKLISTTTYTNTDDALSSTLYSDRHFPYASSIKADAYEVGGIEDGQKITETSTSYTPDSHGHFTSVDVTTTDEDPQSPYSGGTWISDTSASYADDTSSWCLSLPQSISITKSAPGQASITHTSTYTPDGTYCRPASVLEDAGTAAFDITRAYQYDPFGNVSQVQLSGNGFSTRTWKYDWGATGQFEETIQNPAGYADDYEEKIGYDYGLGLKSSDVIQSTGGTEDTPPTQWSHDWLGRLNQESFPDGTTLNWSYSACSSGCYGGMETITETANATQSSGGAEINDQSTYLDTLGRPVAALKRLMDGSHALTEQQYDVFGNVAQRSAPCKGCSSPQYWTEFKHDLLNRPTQETRPAPWTSAGEGTTTIEYAGRKTTITNADNEVTSRFSDVSGVLRRIVDAQGYEIDFTADSDGNVRTVADSQGTITSNAYDYGGEGDYLATRTDRAMGTWSYSPDALGDVCSYTDAKGQEFLMQYDGLGRMTEREDGVSGSSGGCNASASAEETSTQWTWGSTPANHNVGQLLEAQTTNADGTYVEEDGYDGDGRIQIRTITIPGDATYQYGYAYDPNTGLLSQLQYPSAGSHAGLIANYGYTYGVLSSITDASSGTVYWQDSAPVSVNALGESMQDTLGNGVVTQTSFTDVTGWPTKIISGPSVGSASLQNQTFSYDPLGNLTQRQDSNMGLTENFYYYPDNRLHYSTLINSSTTTTNLQLSYNPDGSIAQKTETGGTDTPVGYSVSQWTSYNYPQSISATLPSGQAEGAAFDYGPDRQRWRMVYTEGAASEITEYIGGLMEKVASTGGTQYRYYVYGSAGLAAIVSIDGAGTVTPHYALDDHEGSIASLLNSTGTVAVNESFSAFGNRREPSTWSGAPSSVEEATADGITRQGFTGQTVLGQMALNHMNGRVEDAVTGTFLSPDPYVSEPYNTQDYYRYAYVYNNPLTHVDPSGFDCISYTSYTPIEQTSMGTFDDNGNWIGNPPTADYGVNSGSYCWPDTMPGYQGSFGGRGGSGSGGNQTQIPCQIGLECQLARKIQQQQTNCSDPYVCLPSKPNCGSALPNGSTIGSNVQQVDSNIDQTELSVAQAGGDPTAAGMGVYLGSVGSNGPLDFKNNFRGQGNAGYFGEAGNFAFGAVSAHLFGSGSFGQYVALSGAGVYAVMAGKKGPGIPFLVAPYGADPSAQANTPAGVASSCSAP